MKTSEIGAIDTFISLLHLSSEELKWSPRIIWLGSTDTAHSAPGLVCLWLKIDNGNIPKNLSGGGGAICETSIVHVNL